MDLLINEAPVVLAILLILGFHRWKSRPRKQSVNSDRGIDPTGLALPMITKRPWFGPKRHFGWGWRPASWEGWAVTFLFLVVTVACRVRFGGGLPGALAIVVCVVAYVGVIFLTGAKPGGPNSPRP